MTRADMRLERLRRLKTTLGAGNALERTLVPLVEVCEFTLSHGFREVVVRAHRRLRGGPSAPPRPVYPRPHDDGAPWSVVTMPAADAPLRASIVIPVLNNAALTHHCLTSIVSQTPHGAYEVIVVDNGSDDRTRQMLAAVAGLHVIRNETNAGFVDACNQGARAARGQYVVFLNNDTVVLGGWLDALVRSFELDASVGAVGARLIYPDGRLQEAGGIIWSDGDGWNYGRDQDPDAPEFSYVREVDYCSGACLVVRRSMLESLGGFDTRYAPAYYEDTDLAFRLRERGFRVMYQPAATVVHFEGATAGTDIASGLKAYQHVNRRTFVDRHADALSAQHPHDPSLLRLARDRRRGPRVLVMDHMVPHHDQDSGSVRMLALLRILVDLDCRVTFLPDNLDRTEPYASELQQLGIEVLYSPMTSLKFVERHRDEFEVAILCRARFAEKYVPTLTAAARRPFIIFDTVDLHYLREQRQAELDNDPVLAKGAEHTRQIELSVMRSSDMVWVTSSHEADLLRDTGIASVAVVPNIHTVRKDVPSFAARRNILFIGGFRHTPNEDAVYYFVDAILPLVRAELPGVSFLIVGSHMPRRILDLASDLVVPLGYVPDVTSVFDACRVSVAPLRYGAGVKGKVTQSLAWGLPAVATPIAAEGLHLRDGEHLMVASDAASFARHVVAVYSDEALWTRLSENGRRHIETHLGYEAVRASVAAMVNRA